MGTGGPSTAKRCPTDSFQECFESALCCNVILVFVNDIFEFVKAFIDSVISELNCTINAVVSHVLSNVLEEV